MKRILCLMLCLLVLFSGCTFGQPAPTEGTTVPSTEATEKEHKAPIIGSTEGYEQGEDEWEDDHEETQKPTEKNEYSESADGEGTGVAVSEAVQSATMNYYFMAGEGGRYDPDDHFTRWGDSCLLVFPNGKTMLIDTGLKTFYSQLKAKLADLQVSRLDYVVFTHPHDDHCGALWAGLLTDFSIGQVYHNGLKNSAWGSSAHIATMCSRNNIPCSVLKKGDSLTIGDVTMKVLWPGDDVKNDLAGYHDSGAINNQSLVLRFDYGEHSSLFTGDLYKTYKGTSASAEQSNGYQIPGQLGAEERIAAMYTNGELDVDLLKLPHHGDPSTLWSHHTGNCGGYRLPAFGERLHKRL